MVRSSENGFLYFYYNNKYGPGKTFLGEFTRNVLCIGIQRQMRGHEEHVVSKE